jgi:hypothetical protein
MSVPMTYNRASFSDMGMTLQNRVSAGVQGESNTQLEVRTLMCPCSWIIHSLYQLIVSNSLLEVVVDSS